LVATTMIMMEAPGEAIFRRGLRRGARLAHGSARLARLDALLRRQLLPHHLFTHLRALLPLILLALQPTQLALFGARQPADLCSLLQLPLRLLGKLVGAFLMLSHAPLPLSLLRLQRLQIPFLRRS
jgi:hypothetical protein